jgi:hypothetical protein
MCITEKTLARVYNQSEFKSAGHKAKKKEDLMIKIASLKKHSFEILVAPAIILLIIVSLLSAQTNKLININPDPKGEPWYAGGITQEEWIRGFGGMRPLSLPMGLGKIAAAPAKIDNSILPAFRPVFAQKGGSCAQACAIGYVFTYEMNTLRNVAGNVPENQYPYDFTYNFVNNGSGNYGSCMEWGWDIAKNMGIPTVKAYGGFALGKFNQWVSGYSVYYNGMANRSAEYFYISVSTPAGINTMRQWLATHGNASGKGGCLVFAYNAYGTTIVPLSAGTPEAGKYAMIKGGTAGGHGVTIAGYNDSIRYDYNGDGKYTNNIDINHDGVVNVKDWEKGAFLMVNSWGTSFCNAGKVWVPYKFCAEGMWGARVIGMRPAAANVAPVLTYKVTMSHTLRNLLTIKAGYTDSSTATIPTTYNYSVWPSYYSSGSYPMQGINTNPIEIGMDISSFATKFTGNQAAFFLCIDSKGGTGKVLKISLLDYSYGTTPIETVCPRQNVSIIKGTNLLKIVLPKLTVTTPNGGQKWRQDSTYTITWIRHLIKENVKIQLLKAGKLALVISASAPNSGAFQWKIPATLAADTTYRIQIVSTKSALITDISDKNFTITKRLAKEQSNEPIAFAQPAVNMISVHLNGKAIANFELPSVPMHSAEIFLSDLRGRMVWRTNLSERSILENGSEYRWNGVAGTYVVRIVFYDDQRRVISHISKGVSVSY